MNSLVVTKQEAEVLRDYWAAREVMFTHPNSYDDMDKPMREQAAAGYLFWKNRLDNWSKQ